MPSITGNIADATEEVFPSGKLLVTLEASDAVAPGTGGGIRFLPPKTLTVDGSGNVSSTDIPATTGGAPLYRLTIEGRSGNGEKRAVRMGWFELTADRTLDWIRQNTITPALITPEVVANIEAAAALGATNDTATASFINNPASATATALTATVAELAAPAPTGSVEAQEFAGFRRTHATQQYIVIGVDPVDNLLYANDSTNGVLRQSADYGVTWSNSKGTPTNVAVNTFARVVRFGGHIYTIGRDSVANAYKVYRAPAAAGNAAFTWTEVHSMTAGFNGGVVNTIAAGSQYLYVGDYGDPTGGPSIWRSPDGTTWTRIYGPNPALRHLHAIAEDPHNPGHVWFTMGDGFSANNILFSDDHGTTITAVAPNGEGWQAVDITFTDDLVWFAGDMNGGSVFVCDRDTKTFKWASRSWHYMVPVPGGGNRKGGYVFTDAAITSGSKTLTSATAGFTARDKGRRIAGSGLYPDAYIETVVNATTVTVSIAAATTTTTTIQLEGERFYANGYFGAVDPDTGVFYQGTATGSLRGQTHALFRTPGLGQPVELLYLPAEAATSQYAGNAGVFIFNGYLIWDRYIAPLGLLASY